MLRQNQCSSCLPLEANQESVVADLLDRIAELERQNAAMQQLEQTISRNVYLFGALLSRSQDAIVLVTPEMTILRMVHSVLGYPENRSEGLPLLPFIDPDHGAKFQEAFSTVLERKAQTVELECRVVNPEGLWTWMELRLTDLLDDPHVQAIVLNARRLPRRPTPRSEE
jgi:PAS domain S-box-containing protein